MHYYPQCLLRTHTHTIWPQRLHVHQVPTLRGRVLSLLVLVLVVALVLDGLGAAVRVAVVVEEAAEGELVEGVLGVLAVAEPAVEGVVEGVLALAAPQFVGVHRVEVGGVRGVGDGGDVGRALLPLVAGEVHGPEEQVGLDLVGAVLAQAVLWAAAQLHDQVGRFGAELGLRGNVQRALPVYDLSGTEGKKKLRRANACRAPARWVLLIPSAASPGVWSLGKEAGPPPFRTR